MSAALANSEDLAVWIRDADSGDKDGLLLIDTTSLSGETERSFFFANGAASSEPRTLRARVKANLLSLSDCESGPEAAAALVVLERVMVELEEGTPGLPYPLRLSWEGGGSLTLSTFSEDERESWLGALSRASRELLEVELGSERRASSARCLGFSQRRRSSTLGDKEAAYKGLATAAVSRTFQFPTAAAPPAAATAASHDVICEEWIFESRLSFMIPEQMVKLYISWDQQLKLDLELAFPYLTQELETVRRAHLKEVGRNLSRYQRVIDFLDSYQGPHFKRSTARDQAEFLFIPTNLHIQRFSVFHQPHAGSPQLEKRRENGEVDKEEKSRWVSYDFLTSGSYSAVALGFDDGGCCRIRQTLLEELSEPEMVDSCSEMRFYPRRAVLREQRSRLESLRGRLRRSEDWRQGRFKSVTAERLLGELREMLGLLRDWTDGFPLVREAAEELRRLEAAEAAATPTALLGDAGESVDEGRESLEVQWGDAESLVTSLSTKVATLLSLGEGKEEQSWLDNTRQVGERSLGAVSAVLDSLGEAQLFRLLLAIRNRDTLAATLTPDLVRLHYALQYRRDIIFSQALTTVTTGLAKSLWLSGDEGSEMEIAARETDHYAALGPLFVVISYLSAHGDEKGMLEDSVEAWHQIQSKVQFKYVAAFASFRSPSCTPLVAGSRSDLLVSVPVPEKAFRRLSPSLQDGAAFRVFPFFLNVGINAEAAFGQLTGSDQLETELNADALRDLGSYLEALSLQSPARRGAISLTDLQRATSLRHLLDEELGRGERKNTRLLRLGAAVGRSLHALSLHCCKSGKDRTSMGVTLEEGRILKETVGLAESGLGEAVRQLRTDGVRRLNCAKNIGSPSYAFSSVSVQFLPPDYRPPPATYGILNKYLT